MARLRPGDPPVQGPAPGWRALRSEPRVAGRWSPEDAPRALKGPPPPGTRLRSIRAEFRGTAIGALVLALVAGVVSVVADPPDVWLGLLSSFGGGAVGAAVVMSLSPVIPARYQQPQPWPAGAVAESSRRSFWVTLAVLVASSMAVVVVFAVFSSHLTHVYPTWAGIFLALSGAWWVRQRRMQELESAMEIVMYRDLASWRRLRTSRQSYAQQR